MRITTCAYRVAPCTEILYGTFDVEQGVVIQYPELFNVKVSKVYDFNVILDRAPAGISKLNLISALESDSELLLAINYMGTGIIYVYPDYITYSSNESPETIGKIYKLGKSPLCLELGRRIGGRLTRFSLPDRCQSLVYIMTLVKDGCEYVYTQDNLYILSDEVDTYDDTLNDTSYERAYDLKAFGYVKKDGIFYPLMLVDNKLRIGGEKLC